MEFTDRGVGDKVWIARPVVGPLFLGFGPRGGTIGGTRDTSIKVSVRFYRSGSVSGLWVGGTRDIRGTRVGTAFGAVRLATGDGVSFLPDRSLVLPVGGLL